MTRRTIGSVLAALVVAGGVFVVADTGVNETPDGIEMNAAITAPGGYDRDAFGRAWTDVDKNGCGQRNDVLARDLTNVRKLPDGCTVMSGTLADPYTATTIQFTRGASKVDIDHIVPLEWAWDAGASEWSAGERLAFANDFDNLAAVSASANRAKGSKGPSEWMPPNRADWCDYASQFALVAGKYKLLIPAGDTETIGGACL